MGRVPVLRWGRLLLVASLCLAQGPICTLQAKTASSVSAKEIQDFSDLLKHMQQYPDLIQILESDQKKLVEEFKSFGVYTLRELPVDSFKNLYQRFYAKFVGFGKQRSLKSK
ncbi:MAG: hypothetical protein R3A80_03175 [Bdellovibrionota bacterium]